VWVNPHYPTYEAAQAALSRDKAECNARAYQIYGEYRSTLPQQQQQQISGTYFNSNGGVGFYNGTVTSGRNATPFEAYMDGVNMGNHMGARREYAEACMSRLGWQSRHVAVATSGSRMSDDGWASVDEKRVTCRYGDRRAPEMRFRNDCLRDGGAPDRQ
jgi:hypothetical protein